MFPNINNVAIFSSQGAGVGVQGRVLEGNLERFGLVIPLVFTDRFE